MQGVSTSLTPWRWLAQACHVLAMLLLLSVATQSIAANETTVGGGPEKVEVGVWLSGLHNVDFLGGSFQAEFYIWWISADPAFRPFDSLQVLNGRDWTHRAVNSQVLADGRHYTAGFLSVTASHPWDLFYYPFDRQSLEIIIETPFTSEQLRMVPQDDRSVVGQFAQLKGFSVESLSLSEEIASYRTDFGLDDASGTRFSRLVIEIALKRESGRIVLAILVGFIVANIIALLTFAIDIKELGIRTSMVGSAVFAAIGNMYLLNSQLDPAVGSMIVDRFAVSTFSVILVALICGIFGHAMERRDRHRLAVNVNRLVFVVLLTCAVLFYVSTFHAAMQGR